MIYSEGKQPAPIHQRFRDQRTGIHIFELAAVLAGTHAIQLLIYAEVVQMRLSVPTVARHVGLREKIRNYRLTAFTIMITLIRIHPANRNKIKML